MALTIEPEMQRKIFEFVYDMYGVDTGELDPAKHRAAVYGRVCTLKVACLVLETEIAMKHPDEAAEIDALAQERCSDILGHKFKENK